MTFRLSLILPALIPVAVAAVIAVSPFGADAAAPILVAGIVGAVGVAVAVVLLTRRLSALTATCERILAGDSPDESGTPEKRDELGTITLALLELEARRQAADEDSHRTREAYKQTLSELSAGLDKLADGVSVTAPTAGGPCQDEVAAVAVSLQEAAKKIVGVRQRLAQSTRILQELPMPLVLLDNTGVVRYVNAAAERVLGRPVAACVRKDFRTLLAPPTPEPDPFGRQVLDAQSLVGWFKQGATATAVVEFLHPAGAAVRAELLAIRVAGVSDGLWSAVVRDLSKEYASLETDRTQTREQSLRAVWESTARAGTESVEAILASARLLASDAKQLAGRDTMLPRLATIRQLPQPLLSEFQAAEPVRVAIDQLAPRFKGRNVAITVTDKGGWMCGDDEWIRTAVLGVLSHAGESVQGGTIGIHLNRVAPTGGTTEERIAIEIIDAGPLLTTAQRADLGRPFGGLNAPSFMDPHTGGFIPGLVLAAELSRQVGGLLEFDATPAGGLIVRLVLPARVPAAIVSEPAVEPSDVGPLEELVMGWRLGVA